MTNLVRRSLSAAIFVCVAHILLISCSSRAASDPSFLQGGTDTAASILRELDQLAMPSGVDPAVAVVLKQFLAQLILEKTLKRSLAAWPVYDDSGENALNLEFNVSTRTLKWNYNNLGDYNVDSIVNIHDLVPLAVQYQSIVGDGIGNEEVESWIDSSTGDGLVNLADLLPIGANYDTTIPEYAVLTSNQINLGDAHSGQQEVGRLQLVNRLPGWPLRFEFVVPDNGDRFICLREMRGAGDDSRDYWWDTQDPNGGSGGYKFTDPRDGSEYDVLPGRVTIMLRIDLDDPRVDSLIAAESLDVAMCLPPLRIIGVYLPAGQSIEDAVLNWPGEYPEIIQTVEPVHYYLPQ